MKILSLLLLLALGLGAAWWTQTNPGGSLEDARRDADALAERANTVLDEFRVRAVDALGLTIGRGDAGAAGSADAAGDEAAALASDESAESDVVAPAGGGEPDAETGGSTASASPDGRATSPELLARLDAIEARLADVPARPVEPEEADEDAVEPLRTRLTDVERRLGDAESREGEALERLDTIDARLLSLADRLDTIGTARLGRAMPAEDDADAATGDATALAVAANGADASDRERIDLVVDADEGADTFAADVPDDPVASRIDTLAAGLDRRLARLEERAAEAGAGAARLDALSARIDALATDDTSVDDAQAELLTELAVLDGQVDGDVTSADAPALGLALESTRERLETLEARVRAMPEASAAADAAKTTQGALEAQVRALEARLETLPAVDPALASSIDAVRDQVDALANRGFVTQDELRERTEGRSVEYKIYFDAGSTEVSEAAARVLDSFIVQEQNRTTGVSIFGFTDRRGPASYNQQLALERATNVRSYLIRNGLPYTKIDTISGLGEDAAAAVLPDDADDAQQRVVVLYAAQP